jgi:hypothetical protein
MQTDGNLVLYVPGGHPIWASNTSGNPGAHLLAQNDGNVVIYRPDGHALWATNTNLPTGPAASGDHMNPGDVLNPGGAITSSDGRFRFTYRRTGTSCSTAAARRCGHPARTVAGSASASCRPTATW